MLRRTRPHHSTTRQIASLPVRLTAAWPQPLAKERLAATTPDECPTRTSARDDDDLRDSSTQSGADLSQRINERLDVGAVVVAVE